MSVLVFVGFIGALHGATFGALAGGLSGSTKDIATTPQSEVETTAERRDEKIGD